MKIASHLCNLSSLASTSMMIWRSFSLSAFLHLLEFFWNLTFHWTISFGPLNHKLWGKSSRDSIIFHVLLGYSWISLSVTISSISSLHRGCSEGRSRRSSFFKTLKAFSWRHYICAYNNFFNMWAFWILSNLTWKFTSRGNI